MYVYTMYMDMASELVPLFSIFHQHFCQLKNVVLR